MATLLGTPIMDECPDCGCGVPPSAPQELVYMYVANSFYRRCADCKRQQAKTDPGRMPVSTTQGSDPHLRNAH